MNVLFLTRRFYPDIGGVERHVLEISKRLLLQGHTVTVITESQNPLKKKHLNGITVFRMPVMKEGEKKKFLIWKWLMGKRNLIQQADIIHCHDVFYWYLPFRFLYPKKPVYTTFHGYESYPIKKKAIVVRKISEKLSWGNICIGDFMKKWYGTNPTLVSYGAVETQKIKDVRFKIKDSKSALFFGRLDEQTGIMQYMKAIEIIKNKFPQFNFLVIGDGKYKKNIEKKTKVLGFQKDPERYFAQYRFAFVSRYLSILEAFAAKRLVFAVYDNPVKEDYLNMSPFASFIIIENDPQMLVQRVQECINNPSLEKKMIDEAYHWVQKQTWEKMTKLYLTLWKISEK